ncbi:MAG: ABC transporter substrate-binding protein [Spirochaetaceae bacterium]
MDKHQRRLFSPARLLPVVGVVFAIGLGFLWASGPAQTPDPATLSPPGVLPITEQPLHLDGFIPSAGFIADIQTNAAMLRVSQRTNVHVDWIEAHKLGAHEQLTLLLSGESYPGIIQGASGSGLSMEQIVAYGADGIFLPLNRLIDEHAPNIRDMFDAIPGLRAMITAPDGNIYGLPAVFTDDYHMTLRHKLWLNQDWLDRLGLATPTTTDEFYEVLLAFRDRDANGNGDPNDEIPLTGARRNLEDVFMWIMNAFVPAGGQDESGDPTLNAYEYIIDGTVFFSANRPEFREGLRYIRRLYEENLISINSFTQDRRQIRSLVDGGSVTRLGGVASHHPGNFAQIGDDAELRFRQYRALPPIAGPDGTGHTPWYSDVLLEQGQFVITDAVSDPVVAIRLADYYYSREFAEIDKGIEGVHWRRVDAGENLRAIGGGVAEYEYLRTLVPEDNAQLNLGPVWTRDLKTRFAMTEEFSYEQMLHEATIPYDPYRVQLYPYRRISIPSGSVDEFNDLRRTIHAYIGDSVDRFVIGDLDIDRDWDEYVLHLNRLGLPRYLELLYSAYVRLDRRSGL